MSRFVVRYSPEPEGFPVFHWTAPASCRDAAEAVEAFTADGDDDWTILGVERRP